MGIKIKQIKEGSELFHKINSYTVKTFYLSILIQFIGIIVSLLIIHNVYYFIASVSYFIWIIMSLVLINKVVANFSFINLKFFPVIIIVIPILYFYYFLFRNKYPASKDADYLKNFYRMRKIKDIL
jgi:hypothetical protein